MVGLKIPLCRASLESSHGACVSASGLLFCTQENSLSIVKPSGLVFLAMASKETS